MTDSELNDAVKLQIIGVRNDCLKWVESFDPANEIEDAFAVVEKMRERGWRVELEGEPHHLWECRFYLNGESHFRSRESFEKLPAAICLAALKAMESEGK